MKIIFFGSDDFAGTHLTALLASGYKVLACVTQPDRPQGRGMKLAVSPIKEIAQSNNIPYLQPPTLKDEHVVDALKKFNADIFVVVAYGCLLTPAVLNIPPKGCINVHGSLLPYYRGAAPINWAIINGEKETGVTIQQMVYELDAGDIISQEVLPILPTTTAVTLREDMAQAGAKLLIQTLGQIAANKQVFIKQDKAKVSVASKLTKELGRINWDESAVIIERKIRGLKPWPGCFTLYQGKILKVHEANLIDVKAKPAGVIAVDKTGITVGCSGGALKLITVQPEGGKPMSAYQWALGYKIEVGSTFGE